MNGISSSMRECDVVMKGGITSGVVYPMAVYELSKIYRFRNIGGTSAGAIAATLTAAAEYRRQTQPGPSATAGFEELKKLPAWLQDSQHLRKLFQASRSTHPLFTFIMAVLVSKQSSLAKRVIGSVFMSRYSIVAIAQALVTLAILWRIWAVTGDVATKIICTIVTFLLGLAIFVVAPLLWVVWDLYKNVPRNNYGMCSGMPDVPSPDPPLTVWLADKIDTIAGKSPQEPLTFGDLWYAGNPAAAAAATTDCPGERNINIEMVTTNLTYGRPFTLPFEAGEMGFYYDRDEMRALFPQRIVKWMEDHPRSGVDATSRAHQEACARQNLVPLPAPQDIPIVVAARMSLSFPVLLSAVPLHAVDGAIPFDQINPATQAIHRCWFSDGGLSSNFPIQFFDAPIPGRPTFGINLRAFDDMHTEQPDERGNVWMPLYNTDQLLSSRNGFDDKGPNLFGFLSSIIDSMQNWNDNLQAQVPGFRDRIVHVFLSSEEGGLNLDMSQPVLAKLSERGKCAGDLVVQRFTSPSPPAKPQTVNWENHRWLRYRTATAMLERFVVDFTDRYNATPDSGDPTYAEMVSREVTAAPFDFEFLPAQRDFAIAQSAALVSEGAQWSAAGDCDFICGSPEPPPELQVRPRI